MITSAHTETAAASAMETMGAAIISPSTKKATNSHNVPVVQIAALIGVDIKIQDSKINLASKNNGGSEQ